MPPAYSFHLFHSFRAEGQFKLRHSRKEQKTKSEFVENRGKCFRKFDPNMVKKLSGSEEGRGLKNRPSGSPSRGFFYSL
jgi:hypothetical protein